MKRSKIVMLVLPALLAVAPATGLAQNGKLLKPARTVPNDATLVAQGKKLYAQCGACHGAEAEGRVGMAPSLVSKTFLQAAGDDMLLQTIKKGRAGTTMIPWGGMLSDSQIRSIIAFLRHKTPTEPVGLDQSPNTGHVEAGKKLFKDICRGCHGNNGGGYQETASGTGIGRKAFLGEVSDGYLRYIVNHGKSGTPMRAFSPKAATAVANLKKQEIEDVIAFLRASAW